jgi:hypothetical protein
MWTWRWINSSAFCVVQHDNPEDRRIHLNCGMSERSHMERNVWVTLITENLLISWASISCQQGLRYLSYLVSKYPLFSVAVGHFVTYRKKLIKKHLELRHQARWAACTGCRQSKILMRYPLPSRANELLAVSRLRLRAAVGLLTGHTILTAHLYKLGHKTARMPAVWVW